MPVGGLAKGISSTIGLATEAYAHHKQTKAAKEASSADRSPEPSKDGKTGKVQQSASLAPPPYPEEDSSHHSSSQSSGDEDEADWIRDETEAQLAPSYSKVSDTGDAMNVDQLVAVFNQEHPPPEYTERAGRLPAPVIIPQRRPETKSRGFVRAYAPALADCGIDQSTFMDFHDGFHKATNNPDQSWKKQGWFHASNIAVALGVVSYTATVSPDPIVHFAAVIVHTSIETGRRIYNTKKLVDIRILSVPWSDEAISRTNTYLDQINETLFKPHGLYAMIMTYKPGSSQASELINLDDHIANSVYARQSGGRSNYRTASGKTHGAAEMPEACPLVFPNLEAASGAEKENAFKRAANFARDYNDRRAQATFEAKNPNNSQLNVAPRQEFSSRFADPNHPVNNGGLITLLTGGVYSPAARKRERRGLRDARRAEMGLPPRRRRNSSAHSEAGRRGGLLSAAKRKLHEDVLYLMVVNMPSDEEMRAAANAVARAKEARKGEPDVPLLGFGTWNLALSNASEAVSAAIQAGYRHIDAAAAYGNQKLVGKGIADGLKKTGLQRSDIWVTSKLWNDHHGSLEKAHEGLETTLSELGLDYLDLFLMHWPVAESDGENSIEYIDTWKALESLLEAGLTHHIGVSNFSPSQIRELLAHSTHKPAVHQLETHPYLQQRHWVRWHQQHGIHITAYSPLGNLNPNYGGVGDDNPPLLLKNEVIQGIAEKRGCTAAQVVLKWGIGRGTSVIPKSSKVQHIEENGRSLGCEITEEDVKEVKALEREYVKRFNNPSEDWGIKLFHGLQDA
ncbi:MAG: hypothetical protein Q9214_003756 [Letrouitia sp. 1 TL-2023]